MLDTDKQQLIQWGLFAAGTFGTFVAAILGFRRKSTPEEIDYSKNSNIASILLDNRDGKIRDEFRTALAATHESFTGTNASIEKRMQALELDRAKQNILIRLLLRHAKIDLNNLEGLDL